MFYFKNSFKHKSTLKLFQTSQQKTTHECHSEGDPVAPPVVVGPDLGALAEGEGGDDGDGDQELHRQDAIDLADEATTDLGK